MKTRLNPLESRLHNSPTPEEVRREVAIIKNRLFDLLAALFLSLTMLVTSCSKGESASNASAPANEPVKAKPFEGQIFRTADDRQVMTLVSQDELEMRGGDAGADNLICKYTRQDDTLRVVKTMLGTTLAVYYKITPDGLQANDGTVLFNSAKFLYVKALTRARSPVRRGRNSWPGWTLR